jgi:serine O-acetyltransferase
MLTTSGTAFPEGFDPNFFPADTRTLAGALAAPPTKDATTGAAAPATPMNELESLMQTFDFDASSDEQVASCEAAIFGCLKREAAALKGSWITAGLAQRCILQHSALSDALAAMLSGKLHETLPGTLAYSVAGGSRAESATAEEALRDTMAQRLKDAAVRRAVVSDLLKVLVVDPAADGLLQPFLFFKGFHALTTQRVANSLWRDGGATSQGAALMLQSRCAELFSVDIHPAATIGNGVMLDHASGVVIGSTAVIGSDVYMLHGVTLGATGKPTGGAKRHPTVGSRVVLGAGSTVLGDIAIGDDSTVGAMAIVTKDVPDGATVVGVNKVVSRADVPKDESAKDTDDAYTWYYGI